MKNASQTYMHCDSHDWGRSATYLNVRSELGHWLHTLGQRIRSRSKDQCYYSHVSMGAVLFLSVGITFLPGNLRNIQNFSSSFGFHYLNVLSVLLSILVCLSSNQHSKIDTAPEAEVRTVLGYLRLRQTFSNLQSETVWRKANHHYFFCQSVAPQLFSPAYSGKAFTYFTEVCLSLAMFLPFGWCSYE